MATAKKPQFAADRIASEVPVPDAYHLAEGVTVELTFDKAMQLAKLDPSEYAVESLLGILCGEEAWAFVQSLPALVGLKVCQELTDQFLNPDVLAALTGDAKESAS